MNLKSALLGSVFVLLFSIPTFAAQEIDLTAPVPTPMSGNLKMGGKNPRGVEIYANSQSILVDGKPWLPVMGEMHYSRYPHQEWEQELLKMKAGGINIVSLYVFWIHHEEVENQWDWTGDKDLRQFIELCAKHGLYCVVRIGPWDHGEARNGGIPDWVLTKIPQRQVRSVDPAFMALTRELYTQIYNQVKGLLYKDGGPIIGIQVENEERNAAAYLLALKNLAKEVGFDVPLYTMTGWGPARVPQDELIPMFGGYTDGFWIAGSTVAPASRVQFFFTHNPSDEGTRMTNRPGPAPAAMAYLSRYPYLTCEIGGGMAISYARRPLIAWQDVVSEALCKLGDGSNLMGYYMYHGGSTPLGKLTTLQEQQTTRMTNDNDMPAINYDFQAPIGQFGQVREVYHGLKLLHTFIADFGADLCGMPSILPATMPSDLQDTQTPRWAVRSDGRRGYIFINNYQRGTELPDKPNTQFTLHLPGGDQTVPAAPVIIPTGAFMIWPFNLDLSGVTLRYATAQLLCRLDAQAGAPATYVFFATPGVEPTFAIDAASVATVDGAATRADHDGLAVFSGLKPGTDWAFIVHSKDGQQARVLLLTQDQAMRSWKTNLWGGQRLLISNDDLIPADDATLTVDSEQPADAAVAVFPKPDRAPQSGGQALSATPDGIFTRYAIPMTAAAVPVRATQIKAPGTPGPVKMGVKNKPLPPDDADFASAAGVWHIDIPPSALQNANEVYLRIDYSGDAARAYIGDQWIDDDYFDGRPWEIGLKRFAPDVLSKGITLKIMPVRPDSPVNIVPKPAAPFPALELRGVTTRVKVESQVQLAN
jgi:hypothetical protein